MREAGGGREGASGPVLSRGEEKGRCNRAVTASPGGEGGVCQPHWLLQPLPGRLQTPEMRVATWAAQDHTCPLAIPKETKKENRSFENDTAVF